MFHTAKVILTEHKIRLGGRGGGGSPGSVTPFNFYCCYFLRLVAYVPLFIFLQAIHRCGCMDGLVCQKTTDIAIIPGINIPLEQCIEM